MRNINYKGATYNLSIKIHISIRIYDDKYVRNIYYINFIY